MTSLLSVCSTLLREMGSREALREFDGGGYCEAKEEAVDNRCRTHVNDLAIFCKLFCLLDGIYWSKAAAVFQS